MSNGSEAHRFRWPGVARRKRRKRGAFTYVVAFDGSESARRALERAAPLPRPGDTLALVDVIPGPAQNSPAGEASGTPGGGELTSYREDVQRAEGALTEAAARFGTNGLKITTQVLIGDPASEICRYAEAAEADMIVVGGRFPTEVRDQAQQSVSLAVLRRSRRPVLVCR